MVTILHLDNKYIILYYIFIKYQKFLYKYLIEFDGIQHFQSVNYFGGEDGFIKTQKRDAFKNQWCKDNNIPLIRIPYTHLKDICIEDLKIETSKFKVE